MVPLGELVDHGGRDINHLADMSLSFDVRVLSPSPGRAGFETATLDHSALELKVARL